MSKHTPGPFEVRPNMRGSGLYVYTVGTHRELAQVNERLAGIAREEATANAYLFAAAPDLLSIVKELCLCKRAGVGTALRLAGEAAIAKAEGTECT